MKEEKPGILSRWRETESKRKNDGAKDRKTERKTKGDIRETESS